LKDKAHKSATTESREKVTAPQLPLHILSKLLRPIQAEECLGFASWNLQISEIASLVANGSSGLILVNSGSANAGSVFLKFLSMNLPSQLKNQKSCQILRGIIAEPIHESGWLVPFIGQALSTVQTSPLLHRGIGALSSQDILLMASDVSERCGPLAIFVDGLNLVDSKVLVGDLVGLVQLFCDSRVNFQIFASLPNDLVQWCLEHETLRGQPAIYIHLPEVSEKESLTVMHNRLQQLGLNIDIFSEEIANAIKSSAGDIGMTIQHLQIALRAKDTGLKESDFKNGLKGVVNRSKLPPRSGSKQPKIATNSRQPIGRTELEELMSPLKKT